jgi:hypothetical protein
MGCADNALPLEIALYNGEAHPQDAFILRRK